MASRYQAKKRGLPILALLVTTAIWGLANPVIVYGLKTTSPFMFLTLRFLITTPLLIPFFWRSLKTKALSSRAWLELIGLSFLGITLPIGLIFTGFKFTTALDGSLITILGPLLIVAGGGLLLHEEITRCERVGLIVTLIGSLVILVQPLAEAGLAGQSAFLGNALILASTITWAAYALLDKQRQQKFSPLMITTTGSLLSLLTFAPFAVNDYLNRPLPIANFKPALPSILYMALLSYIAAYYLYEWGIRRIEVSEAALFGYLQPIFAFPGALLLLGEKPTRFFIAGGVSIGVGLILTEYKGRRKPKPNR